MRHWPREWARTDWSPMMISPASGCSRPSSSRAAVVLPEPDSPTRAWVLPRRTVNEMSSTARTVRSPTVKVLDSERTSIWLAALSCLVCVLAGRAPVPVGVDRGDVCLQFAGVLGRRRGEHPRRRAALLHHAVLQHHQRIGPLGGDRQVVGDEQDADPERLLELGEQVEDALLDRHVEARGRLVGHDQRGPGQHRQADQHPLEHAARQLVRIGPCRPGPGRSGRPGGRSRARARGGRRRRRPAAARPPPAPASRSCGPRSARCSGPGGRSRARARAAAGTGAPPARARPGG